MAAPAPQLCLSRRLGSTRVPDPTPTNMVHCRDFFPWGWVTGGHKAVLVECRCVGKPRVCWWGQGVGIPWACWYTEGVLVEPGCTYTKGMLVYRGCVGIPSMLVEPGCVGIQRVCWWGEGVVVFRWITGLLVKCGVVVDHQCNGGLRGCW